MLVGMVVVVFCIKGFVELEFLVARSVVVFLLIEGFAVACHFLHRS